MGYYLQVEQPKGVVAQLCVLGAVPVVGTPTNFGLVPEDKALICVVDNGHFEAAGLCYDNEEFLRMAAPDVPGPIHKGGLVNGIPTVTVAGEYEQRGENRPRTWLLMDKETAYRLSGYTP